MSSFLYFTEQAHRPVSLEDVQGWGLGYAFDGNPASSEIAGRTPSGGKGWLFFDGARLGEAFIGYNPALQEWRKVPGSDVWVGFDKVKRPGPKSLLRSKPIDGVTVKLADGEQWIIPRLRIFAGARGFQSALPVLVDLDEDGHWIAGDTAGGGEKFATVAERLIAGMIDSLVEESGVAPLTTVELLDIAAELLQASYYVAKVEVAMLKLLTNDELLMQIARAAVDFDTAMDWAVKKNGETGSPAVAG